MNRKRILIADDEMAYGKILKDSLEKEGYAVDVAINGVECLEIARAKNITLILLDLIMPIKNGFQVLAEMKKDEKLKKIPVIVLTNLGQEESISEANRIGADNYIIKSDETFYEVIAKINGVCQHNYLV